MSSRDDLPAHQQEAEALRWVEVLLGVILALFLPVGFAASLTIIFLSSQAASVLAPTFGMGMLLLSFWGSFVSFRLVAGRRVRGGLFSPRALRAAAWVFLLIPIAALLNGYYFEIGWHGWLALLHAAEYIGTFVGLRALAAYREQNRA